MYDWNSWKCFTCGEYGHLKARCPTRDAKTPAAPPADAGAASREFPPPVPPRRPPAEIADYARRAQEVRTMMGWDADSKNEWRRRIALAQVRDSRRQRGEWLDHILTPA